MSIRINGTNTAANPGITGTDTDTGLQFGTDEVNIVTGGSTRATVDSSGRLLVGTSTARTNAPGGTEGFLVEGTSSTNSQNRFIQQVFGSSGADGPYLGLAKTRSTSIGGNTVVQSGDELGGIYFQGADGSNFKQGASILSIVDGTPGANDMPGRLVFSTTADGASSPTERMRINSAGRLLHANAIVNQPWGVNVTDPCGVYFGAGTADIAFAVNANNNIVGVFNRTNGSGVLVEFKYNSSVVGTISTNSTTTSYNTNSDYRLKENVVDLDGAIDRVKQLAPKRFNFIDNTETTVDGFLAHEAQTVVPEAVTGTHNEVDDEGNPIYQGIDQSKLVPLLTAALQEAISKIETLEARLTALEGGTN